ncbi:HimA Bacterial nucleoid DNA-binding protein [Burkholderiaceae bacterium]
MNKSDIVRQVYERLDKKTSMKELDSIIDTLLDVMSESLKRGEEVQLSDFGTYSIAKNSIKPVMTNASPKKTIKT